VRILTADKEIARLTAERDEARKLVDAFRVQILDLQARSAHAEGEAAALRQTVEVLQEALTVMQGERERAELQARVTELEGQLSQCLVRATAPAVTVPLWPAEGARR